MAPRVASDCPCTHTHYRLLGADVSYYTAKIRAYLVHKSLPFVAVLATQWILQRVLDAYLAANDGARATIEECLQDIGASELLTLALHPRVIRHNYQLVRPPQV